MIKGRGFRGERLKSARLYRNKTIEQLSKETKIYIEDLKKFELNEELPKAENILSISNKLEFPKEYFYQNDNLNLIVEGTFFNVHSSQYRNEEKSNIEKIKLTHKIFNLIERVITCPKLNVLHLSIDEYNIEKIASKVRKHYELSNHPVINMVNFLEVNGFIISSINVAKSSVGPFLQKHTLYNKPRYFMVLGKDKKSVPVRNYDLGVMFGHVVLHDPVINIDLSKDEYKKIKEEANAFARAFLLPKESFLEDLKYPQELEFYVEMKGKYIVPIKEMIYRAYELGAISSRKYEFLLKEMSKRGWDKKEPLHDIKGANPYLIKKALEVMEENNIMTGNSMISSLANEGLSMNSSDVEELLGLKKGKLANKNIKNSNVTVVNFGK